MHVPADRAPARLADVSRLQSIARGVLEAGVVAVLYYLTARLGLSLAFANKNVTTVWPPTGIAVAAVVLRGQRVWPGIAIGALTANLGNGAPLDIALGFSVGNTLAPLLAALLLSRLSFHPRLDRIIDVAGIAGAAALSMLVSATLGTTILALTGGLGSNTYWSVWTTWWVGDALGVLLFAPVILAYASTPLRDSRIGTRPLEAAICLFAGAVAGYFFLASTLPVQYLVFAFVAWSALRLLQLGATAVILALCIISIWTTVNGLGPHPEYSATLRLVGLDLFNGTLAIFGLLLAAVSQERLSANRALQVAADHLEHEVAVRTDALRRQTLEYQSMLQAISDLGEGAVVVDMLTHRIQYANDAYCRLTGYRLDELLGLPSYLAILAPETQRTMEQTTERIDAARSASAFGEAVVMTKDGRAVPIDWASARVRYGDGEQSIGIVRDATERKRKLGIVEAARDAAQAASRAKGEYLSRMSHELRTPLTVIMGYSDLLSAGNLPPEEREQVNAIMRSAEHLLSLVCDVLDIARIEAGREKLELTPIDAAALCKEAATMMASVAHKGGVALSCDVDGVQCTVRGDPQRLLQVLLNLISNGVKYGGPSVDVSVRSGDDGNARILVADTGPGLSEAEQLLLFQPFQRLGAEHGGNDGTGLGLALSKALVEGMGGTIGVSSGARGTTFWVSLSVDKELSERQTSSPTLGANPSTPALSVLHIEDNPMMIEFVEWLCARRANVHVTNAMQGRMGIELALAGHPDLIILDVHMPAIDGEEVLRRLKEDPTTREIPVVILSADTTAATVERLMALGAARFFPKPIRAKRFLDVLDESIARAGARRSNAHPSQISP